MNHHVEEDSAAGGGEPDRAGGEPVGVEPVRAYQKRLADRTGTDALYRVTVGAIVAPHESQHEPLFRVRGHDGLGPAALFDRRSQRLLAKYVQPGLDRADDLIGMGGAGRRDHHAVQFGFRDHTFVLHVAGGHIQLGPRACDLVPNGTTHRGQSNARHAEPQGARVLHAQASQPDDTQADRGHGVTSLTATRRPWASDLLAASAI